LNRHGKAKRERPHSGPESASRSAREIKSQIENAAAAANDRILTKAVSRFAAQTRALISMARNEHSPALAAKIAEMLSTKSEYFVTQLAELRVLREMSEDELRDFAESRGWRVVRRLGGHQIEFYNDASLRAEL
jgi:hypothetical protein